MQEHLYRHGRPGPFSTVKRCNLHRVHAVNQPVCKDLVQLEAS